MYKKIVGIALATVMTFSVAGVAGAKGKDNLVEDAIPSYSVSSAYCSEAVTASNMEDMFVKYTFEDFSKDFKKGLDEKVIEKAKQLFTKAMNLEENNKFEDASKVWEELEKLDLFDFSNYIITFEEFSKDFKKDLDSKVLAKAKELYSKIIDLEKNGNYDESSKVWEELNKLDLYDFDGEYVTGLITFEDLAKDFKKDISKQDYSKAKKVYEQILKLEENGKFEESNNLLNQLYEMKIFKDYEVCTIKMTFEDLVETFKKDAKKADIDKAKQLFNQITAL